MEVIKFNAFMDGSYKKPVLSENELYHWESFKILIEVLLLVVGLALPIATALAGIPVGVPIDAFLRFK